MKKLVGLVVMVVAIILGSYYVTGLITEHTFRTSLDVINQSSGLTVKIKRYDLGWHTSSAIINVTLHIPERIVQDRSGKDIEIAAKDEQIEVPIIIYHGPITWADSKLRFCLGYIHSEWKLPEQYIKEFDKLFTADSTKPKLIVTALVNYFNKIRFHGTVPEFHFASKASQEQFKWLGLDGNISISSNRKDVDGGVILNGFSFNKDDVEGILGKLEMNYDLSKSSIGFYLGTGHIELPLIEVKQKNFNLLKVNDVDFKTSSRVDDDLFYSNMDITVQKIAMQDKQYGPVRFSMAVKNLDAKVLAEINQQLIKMQQTVMSAKQQVLFTILPLVPKLLSHEAQFELSDVSINTPDGKFKANMLLSLPKEEISNPFQLLQAVKGNARIEIARELLRMLLRKKIEQNIALLTKSNTDTSNEEQGNSSDASDSATQVQAQLDEKIANLIKVGLLSIQGSNYVIVLGYSDGKLMVNGHIFNSTMMQF